MIAGCKETMTMHREHKRKEYLMDAPMRRKTDRCRGLMLGALLAAGVVIAAVDAPARAGEPEVTDEPASTAQDVERVSDSLFRPGVGLGLDFRHDLHWSEIGLNLGMLQDEGATAGDDVVKDDTGTDPRDFSSKFMPYFLYTKLENDLTVKQMNLFGMYAFTTRFAMTYDLPIAKEIDYSDVPAFQSGTGGIGPGSGFGEVPSGGVPFDDLDPDGDVVAMGDLNLRFFFRPPELEWSFDDGNSMGKKKGISLMPLVEMTFPTATEDVLGGESFILSPGFVVVTDIPGDPPFGLGFFAMMNFFDFDVFKDDSRESTTRYRGRWFWMQPLRKPGPGMFDGLYILTEFQPVYDFMESDFSFWIGPEFGKAMEWGAIYAKPGWGIDNGPTDRDFTFEVGFRYFF